MGTLGGYGCRMSVAAPKSTPRPHFAALDGFRGLLALFVAVYHTIWMSWPNASAFLNNGAVIIDLFFAFSGFLMFTLYADRLGPDGAVRDFMAKRFARLFPLHLFMLAAFVGFAVLRLAAHAYGLAQSDPGEVLPFQPGAVDSWRNLLAHLTMTHAMGGADSLAFNPPSWTVGAEFYTYAAFAGVAAVFAGRKLGPVGAAALLVGIVALYATLALVKPDMDVTFDLGLLRCLAGFAIGCLAARARQLGWFTLGRQATPVEVSVLALSIAFTVYCGGKLQFFVGPVLFLFVVVFTQDKGAVSRLMSARPFPMLARISYSVYLTHVLIAIGFDIVVGQALGGVWPDWRAHHGFGTLLLLPYIATVIGVSLLTYRFVELPGGQWLRHRLCQRQRPAVDEAVPAR